MVAVFLAEGFEEIEALTPVDVLRRAGADVKTIALGRSKTVKGAHGIPVVADMTLSQLGEDVKPEMLVLPGGMPGTLNLKKNKRLMSMVKEAADEDRWVAAICAAPSILGELGLLAGRRAVCYPGFEPSMSGATLAPKAKVVRDGNIITGKGMGVALTFALVLTGVLFGPDKVDEISSSILTDAQS